MTLRIISECPYCDYRQAGGTKRDNNTRRCGDCGNDYRFRAHVVEARKPEGA